MQKIYKIKALDLGRDRFRTLPFNVAKLETRKLIKKQFLIYKANNAHIRTMLLETQNF